MSKLPSVSTLCHERNTPLFEDVSCNHCSKFGGDELVLSFHSLLLCSLEILFSI